MTVAEQTLPRNPAPFTPAILDALRAVLADEAVRAGRPLRVVDPFAGSGRIHDLSGDGHTVVGMELEWEWAVQGDGPSLVCDSTRPAVRRGWADACVTSCTYGSRMADHHEARDACNHRVRKGGGIVTYGLDDCPKCKGSGLSPRRTYRHWLGRPLTRGNTGEMPWGPAYRQTHRHVWGRMVGADQVEVGVVRPGGLMVVNVSNHYATVGPKHARRKVERRVVEWHLNELLMLGCFLVEARRVPTPRSQYGANRERVDGEMILVSRTPGGPLC